MNQDETYELLGWQVVTAATVRVGDRLNIDGQHYTVANMIALHGKHKRLIFKEGGTYCLRIDERRYAYRAPP
ncbi:hypothetical protein ACTWP5_16630 [Streptomyces sp. 4N509B]|uniref:hypothetical protein n=1 Tax=Streptomyces sp. 4N509B TaxID=3457413 RepID=UPI003FD1C58A